MEVRFTKMEGCGNDYVYISGFDFPLDPAQKPELVKRLSDRHFGIGGDGVIFINPSQIADFEMEMWNADGTRGEMCGNGIRCVGKFVYDKGLTQDKEITVESFGKVKYLTLFTEEADGKEAVTDTSPVVAESIHIPVEGIGEYGESDGDYEMTCVSMGNPHAVVYIDSTDDLQIETIGPLFENHSRFPNRTNTEFVQIIDPEHVKMRVWERGSGETLACGTGCCAVCVAGVLNGCTAPKLEVQVLGGSLLIEWDREENIVWMTGPATTVFEGTISV